MDLGGSSIVVDCIIKKNTNSLVSVLKYILYMHIDLSILIEVFFQLYVIWLRHSFYSKPAVSFSSVYQHKCPFRTKFDEAVKRIPAMRITLRAIYIIRPRSVVVLRIYVLIYVLSVPLQCLVRWKCLYFHQTNDGTNTLKSEQFRASASPPCQLCV